MASDNGTAGWKNPNDIMRRHRITRHNSVKSSKDAAQSNRRASLCKDIIQNDQKKTHYKPDAVNDKESDLNSLRKRKNPFIVEKNVSAKHQKMEISQSEDDPSSFSSWASSERLNVSASSQRNTSFEDSVEEGKVQINQKFTGSKEDVLNERSDNVKDNDLKFDHENSSVVNAPEKLRASLPMDWSLKLKMRVTTDAELNSRDKYLGLDARNLHGFVHSQFHGEDWDSMDAVCQVKRCCFHYCFPNIPGFKNFPRLSSHYDNRPSPIDTTRQEVVDKFQSEWSRAFMSVYQQLKSSLCPYFYLCCHQFNVLFRCLRSEERCTLTAILSPTTRGFRELLNKEGIIFQMPKVKAQGKDEKRDGGSKSSTGASDSHHKRSARKKRASKDKDKSESTNPNVVDCAGDNPQRGISGDIDLFSTNDDGSDDVCEESNDDDEDDDDGFDSQEDDAASSWLEEIGLESKQFPSLLPKNVKVQRERFREIDNRLQSVIYMEGLHVHAFFNFLLNYPSCTANSGPQYGLPPTILSPTPFQGGTLTINTVKQSSIHDTRTIKQPGVTGQVKGKGGHVLEVSGPILPHHVLNVPACLQSKGGNSSVSFSVHQPSSSFNTGLVDDPSNNILLSGMKKLLVPLTSLDVGLLPTVKDSILSETNLSLKEIGIVKGGFSCVS